MDVDDMKYAYVHMSRTIQLTLNVAGHNNVITITGGSDLTPPPPESPATFRVITVIKAYL